MSIDPRITQKFQSTLPRGSDNCKYYSANDKPNFNPRSLAGATFSGSFCFAKANYFNPRSLAGATDISL